MPEVMKKIITEEIDVKSVPQYVDVVRRYVEELSGEYKENPVFVRKSFVSEVEEKFEIEEGERAAIRWVSTMHIDRDREILLPEGCRLSEFRKAPQVLWGHNYRLPPIGKDQWIKKWPKENPRGIIAKTIYATTPLGEEIWTLVRGGFLRTSSVGFIPLKAIRNGEAGFDKILDKLEQSQGIKLGDRTKIRRIYTDWLLLEHSDVSVPANINALTVAVGKQNIKLSNEVLEDLGLEKDDIEAASIVSKGAVPYEDLGVASEDTGWAGTKEIIDVEDVKKLKRMSTWWDASKPDVKASYKLSHHRASDMKSVWKGVAAAMATLLGAQGGVQLPAGDRKGVYNHLSKHYVQFEKTPPEFREYSDEELKEVFAELWKEILKPFPNEHACRINDPKKYSSFARDNNKFGPGIHAIWGIKDGKSELQSIRFDKSKYSAAEAKKWATDNKYKCKPFEAAAPPKSQSDVKTSPEIEVVEPPEVEEKFVKPEPIVEVIKKPSFVLPIIKEEKKKDLNALVEEELGRKLGKV